MKKTQASSSRPTTIKNGTEIEFFATPTSKRIIRDTVKTVTKPHGPRLSHAITERGFKVALIDILTSYNA